MEYTIYKIVDYTNNNVYIGSTKQTLKIRLSKHKYSKDCSSYEILKNNNYEIIEIEKTDKENRYYREQFYIDNTENCVNKQKAFQTLEKRKEQKKQVRKIRNSYQNSWGGDARFNNNLLCIDINVFN